MHTAFLERSDPRRAAAEAYIRDVYRSCYGADVTQFAPRLVTVSNAAGAILCAAGIRTQEDGFFSDVYLEDGLGAHVPPAQVLEVVSLASTTPFPVLAMLDVMIGWGRKRGMTHGVFTATAKLRKLLNRTGMSFTAIRAADPALVGDAARWGSYYEQDPWVCACRDERAAPIRLSPRTPYPTSEAS